ncbi:hypothetical protein ACE1YR_12965 [Pseudomonas sp. K1(2024)]|uniref:Uncharacterized protein n=1 Tax=Pseudomonas boreofloridensis TaxID=3064348 RepID=A0ABV4Z9Z2_9PSED|nr:hypothetical protein [Pseudomonas sp. K13]MDO7902943.1 hypothetical protein [Pseudomonas sp. K13]
MDQVDDLTRQRIRDWQARRLQIKDEMASHPERTLELSTLLDQMEDEHARILGEATPLATQPETPEEAEPAPDLALRLSVSARSAADLRKLLELALHELDGALAAQAAASADSLRRYPGGMSGSLGTYAYELQATPHPDFAE